MKLGINQILLLHRCLKRGFITLYDVEIIYNLPQSRGAHYRSNARGLAILEKLELQNLISKVPDKLPFTWVLTNEGKEILLENLPKSHNRCVGAS